MHNPNFLGSCGQLEEPVLTENPKKNELWFFLGGGFVVLSIVERLLLHSNIIIIIALEIEGA